MIATSLLARWDALLYLLGRSFEGPRGWWGARWGTHGEWVAGVLVVSAVGLLLVKVVYRRFLLRAGRPAGGLLEAYQLRRTTMRVAERRRVKLLFGSVFLLGLAFVLLIAQLQGIFTGLAALLLSVLPFGPDLLFAVRSRLPVVCGRGPEGVSLWSVGAPTADPYDVPAITGDPSFDATWALTGEPLAIVSLCTGPFRTLLKRAPQSLSIARGILWTDRNVPRAVATAFAREAGPLLEIPEWALLGRALGVARHDVHPGVRLQAWRVLDRHGAISGPEAHAALQDSSLMVRAVVAGVLAASGDPEGTAAAIALSTLETADPEPQITLLNHLRGRPVLLSILPGLMAARPEVRAEALRAARGAYHPQLGAWLREAVQHPHPVLALAGVEILLGVEVGTPRRRDDAEALLLLALAHRHPSVQLAALDGLELVGTAAAIDAVGIAAEKPALAKAAREALLGIRGRLGNVEAGRISLAAGGGEVSLAGEGGEVSLVGKGGG